MVGCEEPDGGRNETPLERLDRNLRELLSELRVVVTGVRVQGGTRGPGAAWPPGV
jgi:Family of unknown function (DUF6328)